MWEEMHGNITCAVFLVVDVRFGRLRQIDVLWIVSYLPINLSSFQIFAFVSKWQKYETQPRLHTPRFRFSFDFGFKLRTMHVHFDAINGMIKWVQPHLLMSDIKDIHFVALPICLVLVWKLEQLKLNWIFTFRIIFPWYDGRPWYAFN